MRFPRWGILFTYGSAEVINRFFMMTTIPSGAFFFNRTVHHAD